MRLTPAEVERFKDDFHAPVMIPDHVNPRLLTLERVSDAPEFAREARTARDFADFVRKAYGQTFVYASQLDGACVPSFDGFLLDDRGRAVRNVSLKYDSLKRARPEVRTLARYLADRVEKPRPCVESFARWCAAVNAWSWLGDGYETRDSARDILRAQKLWSAFGLSVPRPLTVVVDVRDSGWTFEFVREAAPPTAAELTLLWSASRVIELGKG